MSAQNQQQGSTSSCSMTGLLGIIIQLALGILSFSVLILKRFRQQPRRPWKIWSFDTSKQLISQVIAHFINLTISLALAYSDSTSDECLWYFITNILDNTVGVLICVGCLRVVEYWLRRRGKTEYISGNYYTTQKVTVNIEMVDMSGVSRNQKDNQPAQAQRSTAQDAEPPKTTRRDQLMEEFQERDIPPAQDGPSGGVERHRVNYKAWLVQLAIWVSIVVLGKSVIFGFEFGLQSELNRLSSFLMGWIEQFPVLQLLVVIVVVPVVMNGLAFWVQDNFLMKKDGQTSSDPPLVQEATTPSVKNEDILDIV